MYEYDCDKVKLQLERNTVIGCNGLKDLVMMNPYNSLKADIHKDQVGPRGAFILVIDARREDHSKNEETILGFPQTI